MKTKTYSVYSFAELSADAKQRAKDQHASQADFAWGDDYKASLEALAAHFGGKLSDYSLDWSGSCPSSACFDMPEMDAAEIEARMAELGTFDPVTLRGNGDCKLTGFCADENAIDGFRAAWHAGERSLGKLMQAAFREWLKDAQADCADQYEDEAFSEHCESNGYEFTEDGRID